jgi:phosphatidylserine decarboxylase
MVSDGYKFIAVPLAISIAAAACAWLVRGGRWLYGASAVFLLLALFVLYFFRDPERTAPSDPDAVVSPADGRVVAVVDESLDGRPGRRVSVFLSVMDVHVNRAPLSGTITRVDYRPGRFHGALFEKASAENEQNVIRMSTARGEMVFRQIAGFIARRVLCWKTPGEAVHIGDRIGMIRFGSRVDVWLPAAAEIIARPGDRVLGGESILARWK